MLNIDFSDGLSRLEPIEPFPWLDYPVELAVISADDAGAEVPLDAAGLELLTGAEGEDWAASGFDPQAGGDLGPDGPPGQGDLADLWVAGADDPSDWWTGDGEDGADWFAGEAADDWLVTDLEG